MKKKRYKMREWRIRGGKERKKEKKRRGGDRAREKKRGKK